MSTAKMTKIMLAEDFLKKQTADAAFAEALLALEKADAAVQNLRVEGVNKLKAYKACPEKTEDVCMGINFEIIPVNQKSKLADWNYIISKFIC